MGNKKGTKDSLQKTSSPLLTFMIANLPIDKKANESIANSKNDKKRQLNDDERLKKREKHNKEVCIMIDLSLNVLTFFWNLKRLG